MMLGGMLPGVRDPRLARVDAAARGWSRPLVGPAPRASDGLVDDSPLGWQDTPVWRAAWARLAAFGVGVLAISAGVAGLTNDRLYDLVAELASCLGAWLAVVVVLEGRRHPVEWRLRRWPGLLAGLAVGAILCALSVAVLWALRCSHLAGLSPTPPHWTAWWTLGVVAGISEEIMLRGVVFRLAESWLGTWWAVLGSGLVFGLLHLGNPHATLVGALAVAIEAGLSLALLYAWTRSLWVVMGAHAAWNLMEGPVFGLVVSGSSAQGHGLLVTRLAGPDLLTGGPFGIEASLVSVLTWSVLTCWLAWRIHRSGTAVRPVWVRHRTLPGNPI